ncbi:uncharacterized protein LY79DRAFT_559752 [Colletotrichum navitas]|uniref:RING-type E3 ubiquitin transferase n=1 Tax=Colletotrichum navitas TaxID=681940 RepID=A0AAD8PVV5_9PEZI|nr:uncharacterized protein LY79DRAFT_559752 [Colletotrichum navitas]KAK1584909.1 hypothetical protein LY79DRAFT_559752 [Colletotrichum navitas]
MSPTSIPDAAHGGQPSHTDYEKHPVAVRAAICVAFAFLICLLLYMLGWGQIRKTRHPVPPPVPQPDHTQYQHNRNVNEGPGIPKPATLTCRKLSLTAEGADARPCPVCLDDFAAGTVAARLPCGHVFCSACIEHWVSNHAFTCPMCRFNLETGSAHVKDWQH